MMPEWQLWFEFAERDLRACRCLLDGKIYANACLYAQQAVEKALKGLLLYRGKTIPKTHNLPELLVLLEENTLTPHRDATDILNKYYLPVRYPDLIEGDEPSWFSDENEARNALTLAGKITKTVTEIIQP